MPLSKLFFSIILAFTLLVTTSVAQDKSSLELSTVVEDSEMEDDTKVMLEGFILSQSGDEEYIFGDDTGEISVEIDDDSWRGQNPNEKIKVRIMGELEKDGTSEVIDVEILEIIDL